MIKGNSLNTYLLRDIKPLRLKNYLVSREWTQEPFKRKDLLKFKSPTPLIDDNEYVEVLVPLNEKIIDYPSVVELAIENISAFEGRNFEDILYQILNFGDSFKIKVSTIETKKGCIPLSKGISLYEYWKDLLIYSVCAELYPNKKNFLRKLKDAANYVDKSLIGQSQYGSYIANIYCPLPLPRDRVLGGEPLSPIERRTVLRVLRGLQNVSESIDIESPDPIIDNYSKGLNSNMCDALINIIELGEGSDIIVSANLEPVWIIPNDIKRHYILNNSSKYYLEQASDILKEAPSEIESELIGYILKLERPADTETGDIELIAFDEETKNPFRVKAKLDTASYQLAIRAHSKKANIRIKGLLKKLGRRWYLDNPEGLEITEENDTLDHQFSFF